MKRKDFFYTGCIKVTSCSVCPFKQNTMDGPECELLSIKFGAYEGFVYPEGRDSIHPKCLIKPDKL